MQNKDEGFDCCHGSESHDNVASNAEYDCLTLEEVPEQIYLAQVRNPIAMR